MREPGDNSTEWQWLIHELNEDKGQDAFGFAFSVISVLGVCVLMIYLVRIRYNSDFTGASKMSSMRCDMVLDNQCLLIADSVHIKCLGLSR